MKREGTLFDIKRFAIHDGPGIRTTVFFKECLLSCRWCHNPESRSPEIQRVVQPGAGSPEKMVGERVTVSELLGRIEQDRLFYDQSGGGVTFSGGEPLAQPAFLLETLERCGERDIHRAVDTTGFAPSETLSEVAPHTDLFLCDLKLMDAALHERYTGVPNEKIIQNLRSLLERKATVEIRVPLIPGITDGDENLDAIGTFLSSFPAPPPVRLLGHHALAMGKYERFGVPCRLPDTPPPTPERMNACVERLGAFGLDANPG